MSDPHALSRPARPLAVCLHLLMAGLLALAAVRAVTADLPHPGWAVAVAAAMAAVYCAGPLLARAGRRRTVAAVTWLAALWAAWGVLLWLTQDAVWLAFPLCLLQVHLLPVRWGLPAAAVTAAAAVAGFAWHQGTFTAGAVIGPLLGCALAAAGVLGYRALYQESERHRQLVEQLTAARHDLAAAERAAGTLAERERLAREIHDTLAQGLSSIQLLLRAAERALPGQPGAAARHVRLARAEAQRNLDEARRFVRALAPPDLEDASLPVAVQRVCGTVAGQSGVAVRFRVDGDPVPLPASHELALLRIAQSALSNVTQHARATRADVTLSYMDTNVALDVVDDGIGFEPAAGPSPDGVTSGFGLRAMRARAVALGGTLSVEAVPGSGTALSVTFPVPSGLPADGGGT